MISAATHALPRGSTPRGPRAHPQHDVLAPLNRLSQFPSRAHVARGTSAKDHRSSCPTCASSAKPAARTEIPRPKRGRGPVGARLHRAAEQERAVQEGRRPAQRPGPDPAHLLQARLRLDRPRRPARPLPVDGPLHPARPGLRRRQDRDARGGGARRRVLHDAGPLRRRPALRRRRPRPRQHRRRLRPRHRRRHRPREHPVPLDPDRGRAGDLGAARRRRAVARIEACGDSPRPFLGSPVAGVAADEIIDGSSALDEIKRRYIGNPEFSNLPRKFKTALTGHPSHDVAPEINDVVVRRHRPPRARPRLRPLGRRRAVHQPDARRRSSASGSRSTRSPTPGRASPRSSATTATAGCARGPG